MIKIVKEIYFKVINMVQTREGIDQMTKFLFLNTETLISTLFWCNLAIFIFLGGYYRKCNNKEEKKIIKLLFIEKLLHTLTYFCLQGRNILPDFLSVNVGNSALFVGFYLEAQVIFLLIREKGKHNLRILQVMLAISLLLFNVLEILMPQSGLRVTVASLCIIIIMMYPNLKMFTSRDTSSLAKLTSVLYMFFLLLQLPRAWSGVSSENMSVLTNSIVQSLTFESLILILLISIPSYILIIKEYSDEALILMATTDKMTGATNRHAFMEAARAVYNNHVRHKITLSVLFLDIDKFKSINDKYGHAFGDEVLIKFAEVIDQSLWERDLSCRYGGEEFVILLTRTNKNEAELVGKQIMSDVEKLTFDGKEDFSFTVSIGVYSAIAKQEHTLEEYINFADQAMYVAKNSGRNRIVIYEEKNN